MAPRTEDEEQILLNNRRTTSDYDISLNNEIDVMEEKEYLNPPHNSILRKTSLNNATFNLVATIVGGGVLSLPQAFAQAGIVLTTLMLIFSGAITEFSLYLVCSCARRTGSTSYMEIMKFAWGDASEVFVTFLMWLFLSGVLVAYSVLMMGIFSPLVKEGLNTYFGVDVEDIQDSYVLAAILLTVSYFILQRNLYALRHICYVGFTSVCIIIISMSIRAFQKNFGNSTEYVAARPHSIKYYSIEGSDILSAFPIIILSFMCTHNMIEVQGALVNPTMTRVGYILRRSLSLAFILFLAFGLAGYFYAYSECHDNIFLNFGM